MRTVLVIKGKSGYYTGTDGRGDNYSPNLQDARVFQVKPRPKDVPLSKDEKWVEESLWSDEQIERA